MNDQIEIIADGSVLKALKLAMNGVEFSGSCTRVDTHLIVYADTLTSDARHRSERGGLRLLQKLLANPASKAVDITLLSFRVMGQNEGYDYLWSSDKPASYNLLPLTMPLPARSMPSKKKWRTLVRTAAEMELEIECAAYRHGLRSIMAAARIYLGAAIGNDLTIKKFKTSLPQFEKLARDEDPSVRLDSKNLIRQLLGHQRFRDDYKSAIRASKGNVWVLDDHWEHHGWRLLFDDLFPGRASGFKDWESLRTRISQSDARPEVLIIDCNLGAGDEIATGLELLHSIRSVWQDVRIIFATSYDDASLALTSLREGANLFFAKTLDDAADRRSLDYYTHFAELLQTNDLEQKISTRWRRFQPKGKPDRGLSVKSGFPAAPSFLNELIRLGFYILFSLIDKNLWWVGKRGILPTEALFRAVANTLIVGYPDLEDLAAKEAPALAKLIRASVHGGEPVSFDNLLEVFDFLLGKLEDQFTWSDLSMKPWARPRPSYWPYQTRALQSDSTHPGLPAGTTFSVNDSIDALGAIELVRGINCTKSCTHGAASVDDVLQGHNQKKGKKSYEDVAFIDEHGGQSGWFEAVGSFLPGCQTYNNVWQLFDDVQSKSTEIDLVLLDLNMPTSEIGLQVLNTILLRLPSVPIVALSAGHDSLAAIRSLRSGATDFVSKALPFPRSQVGCYEFADELRTKCQLLLKFGRGKCREHGVLLDRLQNNTQWSDETDLTLIKKKIKRCREFSRGLPVDVEIQLPPNPERWPSRLSEEMALILYLRQQVFWLTQKKEGATSRTRLNVQRTYHVRPLDYWRWEQVLCSEDRSGFVKLGAILSGVVVDRIANWNWSLQNKRPLQPAQWGTRIIISDEMKKIGGEHVWRLRNQALYPDSYRPPVWNESLLDYAIDETFGAIKTFLSGYGAQF
jgi:CheY-like chemotaxis protein